MLPNKLPEVSTSADVQVEFDLELGELERAEGITPEPATVLPNLPIRPHESESRARAYPLTLGLVMHALADGFALGSSVLSGGAVLPNAPFLSGVSFVIFLALIIHKGTAPSEPHHFVLLTVLNVAPTALALTTSLMSTGLPRNECKRHLAIFSASTPIAALFTYMLFAFFDANSGPWPGIALLISVSVS